MTASNIAMEEDQKDEEANKNQSKVDVAKIEADINTCRELAAKVGAHFDLFACLTLQS